MTFRRQKQLLARLGLSGGLLVASCRCGGADRHDDAGSAAAKGERSVSAWSARFELPPSWSGGENDAGGYEYTNGEIALMVGRAPGAAAPSLDAFFLTRVSVLEQQGRLTDEARAREPSAGKPSRSLSATVLPESGAPLAVRLLVVEPNGDERISLLMVGEKARSGALAQSWEFVVRSLRFE